MVSYDKNERVYNPPMPLLFQWRCRLENRAVGETSLRKYLDHALAAIGVKDASGHALRYTFHDFRRLFITDCRRTSWRAELGTGWHAEACGSACCG